MGIDTKNKTTSLSANLINEQEQDALKLQPLKKAKQKDLQSNTYQKVSKIGILLGLGLLLMAWYVSKNSETNSYLFPIGASLMLVSITTLYIDRHQTNNKKLKLIEEKPAAHEKFVKDWQSQFLKPSSSSINHVENYAIAFKKENSISLGNWKKYLDDFVKGYLDLYITGTITRENEPKNREPMMSILVKHFRETVGENFDPEAVETLAYGCYLTCSIKSIYAQLKTNKENNNAIPMLNFEIIEPKSNEFEVLLRALKEALPKDFLSEKLKYLSENELRIDVTRALLKFNLQISELKKIAMEGVKKALSQKAPKPLGFEKKVAIEQKK